MAINQLVNFTLSAKDEISASAAKSAASVTKLSASFNTASISARNLSDRIFGELIKNSRFLSDVLLGQASALGAYRFAVATAAQEISNLGGATGSLSKALASTGEALTPLTNEIVPISGLISNAFNGIPTSVKTSIAGAVNSIDGFMSKVATKIERQSKRIPAALEALSKPFGIFSSVREAQTLFNVLKGSVSSVASAVFDFTQQLGLFGLGLQALQSLVNNGPFAALIGQNIQLREQLLATRTSLAATNQIISNGQVIDDPGKAIAALEQPINNAIEQLREKSLDLVGVTSSELVPLFQLVAQNAGGINADFDQMTELALGFAATMGTANIPLSYAGEEVRSILTGTADMNTQMLRYLGLNNQQLRAWSAQGVLVDKLNERFSVFLEGNKTAASQFNGVTSNIKEIFEIATQAAGVGILDTLNKTLTDVYTNLQDNREALTKWFIELGEKGVSAFNSIAKGVGALATAIAPLGKSTIEFLFTALADGSAALAVAIERTLGIFSPFLNILGALLKAANPLNTILSQLYFQTILLSKGSKILFSSFNFAAGLVGGLGDAMFLLNIRTNPLFATFAGLSQTVKASTATWLTLGTKLNKIPGAMNAVANALGPLGGVIAPLLPQLSQMGVGLIGLSNRFPVVRELMNKFSEDIPQMVGNLAPRASKKGFHALANELTKFSEKGNLAAQVNDALAASSAKVGKAIRAQVISLALGTAGIVAAVFIFDKFVLKNKELMTLIQAFFGAFGDFAHGIKWLVTQPLGIATVATTAFIAAIVALRLALAGTTFTLMPKVAAAIMGLSNAMLSLKGVVAAMGFAQSAAAAQAASTALVSMTVAAKTGTLTFGLLTKAVLTFTATAVAAAAPLIAIAAAIALIAITKRTADLYKANQALALSQKTVDLFAQKGINVAAKLKEAKDAQVKADKAGVALTKKELEVNKEAQRQKRMAIKAIDLEIAAVQKRRKVEADDNQKKAFDNQIKQLEGVKKTLNEYGNNIRIANRELEKLGTSSQQNAKLVKDARKILESPSDSAALTRGAEQLIDATTAQVKAGELGVNEAAKQLLELTQIDTLKVETQRKAKDAAIALVKEEFSQRQQALDANIKVIESSQKAELTSAQKATSQIAGLRTTQAKERLQAIQSELKVEMALQGKATQALVKQQSAAYDKIYEIKKKGGPNVDKDVAAIRAEIKSLDDEIGESTGVRSQQVKRLLDEQRVAQAAITESEAGQMQARRALRIEDFDERKALLEAEVALGQKTRLEGIESQYANSQDRITQQLADLSEQRQKLQDDDIEGQEALGAAEAKLFVERAKNEAEFLNQRRSLFEQEQAKLLSEVELAEVKRNITIQELRNETAGKDEEFAKQQVELTRDTLEKQLQLAKKSLSDLQALPKLSDPAAQEEIEGKIRESKLKTANLVLSLAKNEEEQQRALTRTIQAELDRRIAKLDNFAKAQENILSKADLLTNASSDALKTQSDLLAGRGNLQQAITGYVTTQYDILQRAAKTEKEKNDLAKEAAKTQKDLLEEQLKIEAERLKISQEQRRNELALQALKARASQFEAVGKVAKARIAISKAEADPNTSSDELEALKLSKNAAQAQVDLSDQTFRLVKGQLAKLGQIESLENKTQSFNQSNRRDRADIAIASVGTQEEQQEAFTSLARGRSNPRSALSQLKPQNLNKGLSPSTAPLSNFLPGKMNSVLSEMNNLKSDLGNIATKMSENTTAMKETATTTLAELKRQTQAITTRRPPSTTPAANVLASEGI